MNILQLAYDTLMTVENGGSFSVRDWDNRMAEIEQALGMDTARSRCLQANVMAGQAKLVAKHIELTSMDNLPRA